MNDKLIEQEVSNGLKADTTNRHYVVQDLMRYLFEKWYLDREGTKIYDQKCYINAAMDYHTVDMFYLSLCDDYSSDGSEFESTSTVQDAILQSYLNAGIISSAEYMSVVTEDPEE